MIKVHDIAYVRFSAPDLDEMEKFGREFGFEVAERGPDVLYLRGTDSDPWIHSTVRGEPAFLGFGLAAASFFPVITLGIFSKRVSTLPAVAGMIAGIGFTASYILSTVFFGGERWCFGIGPQGIGAVGMVVNFVVAGLLTPICRGPSEAARQMVAQIRAPEQDGAAPPAAGH